MDKKFIISAFADEAGALFTKQIEAMKTNGVDCLEMRGVNGRNVSDMTSEEAECAAIMLKEAGLYTWSIGSPIGKIDVTDPFEPHAEKFKRVLEAAAITGAECIRIFSFYGVDTDAKRDEAMERLSKLIEIAQGSDVILCHENEKGIFGDSAENCLYIMKSLPKLKAVFDPANFVQCGVDTKRAWEMLSPYVYYLHIKDALPDGKVVPAGKGVGNLAYIVSEFGKKGGKVLSLEPHLAVFKGFAALEREYGSIKENFTYSSSEEAFAASADALKAVIS